ncbi:hypothetical protein FSARC_14905 [Fusarium sarcochroum]|uniref:Uncharacterized protein n=1 Tax=Fusarium sarcochroum TaxID=1208366 RepID=A0A8H4WMX0_9HYPO|nr:hypothetical protein FSARC_14905 [Fusarium sarcochroum]
MVGNTPVRTGDLGIVIKALDNLTDRRMTISSPADKEASVGGQSQVDEGGYDSWEGISSDANNSHHDLDDDLRDSHQDDEVEEREDDGNEGFNLAPGHDESNGETMLPELGGFDDVFPQSHREPRTVRTCDEDFQQPDIAGAGGSGGETRRPRPRMRRSYCLPSSSEVGGDD